MSKPKKKKSKLTTKNNQEQKVVSEPQIYSPLQEEAKKWGIKETSEGTEINSNVLLRTYNLLYPTAIAESGNYYEYLKKGV